MLYTTAHARTEGPRAVHGRSHATVSQSNQQVLTSNREEESALGAMLLQQRDDFVVPRFAGLVQRSAVQIILQLQEAG